MVSGLNRNATQIARKPELFLMQGEGMGILR
jgi:hypothetical protein